MCVFNHLIIIIFLFILIFAQLSMIIKLLLYFLMINSTYLYIFSFVLIISITFIFLNFKPSKNHINNKILLKSLLESLDLELPEELKQIDNSSTDT